MVWPARAERLKTLGIPDVILQAFVGECRQRAEKASARVENADCQCVGCQADLGGLERPPEDRRALSPAGGSPSVTALLVDIVLSAEICGGLAGVCVEVADQLGEPGCCVQPLRPGLRIRRDKPAPAMEWRLPPQGRTAPGARGTARSGARHSSVAKSSSPRDRCSSLQTAACEHRIRQSRPNDNLFTNVMCDPGNATPAYPATDGRIGTELPEKGG